MARGSGPISPVGRPGADTHPHPKLAGLAAHGAGKWANFAGRGWASGAVALEEEDARRGAASAGDHRGLRIADLALAGVVAELLDRLVDEDVAVGAALGQLAAVPVHPQVALE